MVAVDGVGLGDVVAVDYGGVYIYVKPAGVEGGVVVAADGEGVDVGCGRSLAISTAHKELGEGELGVEVKVETSFSSFASESSAPPPRPREREGIFICVLGAAVANRHVGVFL